MFNVSTETFNPLILITEHPHTETDRVRYQLLTSKKKKLCLCTYRFCFRMKTFPSLAFFFPNLVMKYWSLELVRGKKTVKFWLVQRRWGTPLGCNQSDLPAFGYLSCQNGCQEQSHCKWRFKFLRPRQAASKLLSTQLFETFLFFNDVVFIDSFSSMCCFPSNQKLYVTSCT